MWGVSVCIKNNTCKCSDARLLVRVTLWVETQKTEWNYKVFRSPRSVIVYIIMRWTSLHTRLWPTEPFRGRSFHTWSRYHHLLLWSKQGFLKHSKAFSVFCCFCPKLVRNVLLASNSKCADTDKNKGSSVKNVFQTGKIHMNALAGQSSKSDQEKWVQK